MTLDYPIFQNTLLAWASALGVTLLSMIALALVRRLLRSRLQWIATRTGNRIDDAMVHAVDGTRLWLLLFVVVNLASNPLELPARVDFGLRMAALLAGVLQLGLWLGRLMDYGLDDARKRAMESDASAATSLLAFKFIGQVVMWSVLLLLAMDNVGIDVTALVAGLGIGGVAIALAVQNILGDLFASMSILVDKPFVIGDFIIVDDFLGTVEHIGLKTTRLRSLGGEQLIFSNSDLLSTRIRNYKRMSERRVVFGFGVLYQSTPEQLEQIPQMLRSIIEEQSDTRFDRAHFKSFGDSSYDFEVVYWMCTADYNTYMDVQQRINLAMVRAFARAGIEFAYPTRTLFLEPSGVQAALGQEQPRPSRKSGASR